MIDTGAEVNIVGDYWVTPHVRYRKMKNEVKGLTGHAIRLKGMTTVACTFTDGRSISIRAAIATSSKRVILGMPFLAQAKAEINIAARFLKVQSRAYVLQARTPYAFSSQRAFIHSISVEDGHVRSVLEEYRDLWEGKPVGRTHIVSHRIKLTHSRPLCCRPRKYSEEQMRIIDEEVDKMLTGGIIRPSQSPYASAVVLVKKKTGDWRFCIDYRPLNKITIRDEHPLPRIKDLLKAIKESRYFIALDLKAGYWQISMEEQDIPKTAFRTHRGLYEFVVMPFGLVNAPATFQRLMESLFGDYRWRGILTYLDDILLHAKTRDELNNLLYIVLNRLREANLTINLEKCEFLPPQLRYLGHIIDEHGMRPDIEKVQALKALNRPSDLGGVRRILGLFGYYRDFIRDYAKLTEPLVDCLRGKKKFSWNIQQETALENLKASLSDVVLRIPLETDNFVLETDASGFAIGAILSVEKDGTLQPVEFASHMLSAAERKWPIREKEAYAIVWALKHFDEYLRGKKLKVYTDHQSLKWFLSATKGKLSRWAQCLSEYDLEVYYKKGNELVHVDAISRNPEECDIIEDRMVLEVNHMMQETLPTIQQVKEWTHKNEKSLCEEPNVTMLNGLPWYRGVVYVPTEMRLQILDFFHSSSIQNHPGVHKTLKKIKKLFDWPNIDIDVRDYIRGCLTCQRIKPGPERKQGIARRHPETLPFEVIHIDFWGPVEAEDEQKVHILSIIDRSTRWAEAVVVESKNATVVSSKLLTEWCCRYGFPHTIVADQDPTFCDTMLAYLYSQLGIKEAHSTVYHPQGNAPVESFHRALKKGLSIIRRQQPACSMNEALQMTLFAYRSSVNLTTGESPSYLTFGLDIGIPPEREWQKVTDDMLRNRLRTLSEVRMEVMRRANAVAEHHAARLNEKRKPVIFNQGDLILVRLTDRQLARMARVNVNKKFLPCWGIPCRVVTVMKNGYTALCRNLLLNEIQEVHLQNARMLSKPRSGKQKQIWEQEVSEELGMFTEEGEREELLRRFWREVEGPIVEDGELQSVTNKRSAKGQPLNQAIKRLKITK